MATGNPNIKRQVPVSSVSNKAGTNKQQPIIMATTLLNFCKKDRTQTQTQLTDNHMDTTSQRIGANQTVSSKMTKIWHTYMR